MARALHLAQHLQTGDIHILATEDTDTTTYTDCTTSLSRSAFTHHADDTVEPGWHRHFDDPTLHNPIHDTAEWANHQHWRILATYPD